MSNKNTAAAALGVQDTSTLVEAGSSALVPQNATDMSSSVPAAATDDGAPANKSGGTVPAVTATALALAIDDALHNAVIPNRAIDDALIPNRTINIFFNLNLKCHTVMWVRIVLG